jgi:transcriptional regulator with XRE-family HTH domain
MNHQPLTWKKITKSLDSLTLQPDEFLRRHPDVSRKQLASLIGCSLSTVNKWLAKNTSQRPSHKYLERLALAHLLKESPAAAQLLAQ